MKRLFDIAQDAYVSQRVRKKTTKDTTGSPQITGLPPFSLGVQNKRQRKDVIRSKIRKKTRLTKRHVFFQECIADTTRPVPFPVMIELGKLASSLCALDDDQLTALKTKFEKIGRSYFKIGQWDQNEYEGGTGKGNIYAVRQDEKIYLVVCDFEEECLCSVPIHFSAYVYN